MSLLLGPILQFRGIRNGQYHVSALVILPLADNHSSLNVSATSPSTTQVAGVKKLAEIPFHAPTSQAVRIDLAVNQGVNEETVTYVIGGVRAGFVVPGRGHPPRMAYGSCFGFSDPKLMRDANYNYERWDHLKSEHLKGPFNLLLMGGDQVYSEAMVSRSGKLKEWYAKSWEDQESSAWTNELERQVDNAFLQIYTEQWQQKEPGAMLRSIPTIMMWDDHDIIDGWGSYSEALHECPVFKGLFKYATKYFRIFQQQLADNESHPCAIPGSIGFHMGFADIGGYAILVPDLRYERRPVLTKAQFAPTQIVSDKSWTAIMNWLAGVKGHKHLLLLSSIPVAYIDLSLAESLLLKWPGRQSYEDDLRDHWRSQPHKDERRRLIRGLLDFAALEKTKVTMVSGDVHVAGCCLVESSLPQHAPTTGACLIYQLISTGMVHPSPSTYKVFFLENLGSAQEDIDLKITGSLVKIGSFGRYLIPERNWLALEPDKPAEKRDRLWAKWHVEGDPHPVVHMIDPI